MFPALLDRSSRARCARPTRAPAALAALLVLAALSLACERGGQREGGELPLQSDALQTADALEAREVLERFLGALAAGRYEDAEKDFSGDLTVLRDLSWMVAPDDVAELLGNYCTRHHGACLPARLVSGRVLGPGSYELTVEYLDAVGKPIVVGDTMMPQTLASRFPFRVQRIGIRYYVLDLPPRLR